MEICFKNYLHEQKLNEDKLTAIHFKIKKELSWDARKSIEEWSHSNWVDGRLENHFKNQDDIAKEIEEVFSELRNALPKKIKLYRGIIDEGNYMTKRYLESWTDDIRVAEYFATLRPSIFSPRYDAMVNAISKDDVETAYKRFKKQGYVVFNKKLYRLNKDNPHYYDVYKLSDNSYAHYTDGVVDEIYDDMMDIKNDRDDYIKDLRNKTHTCKVLEKVIDRDDIVWFINNKQQRSREYIVKMKN